MNNNPQISVCISMYNASKYLNECVDSILSQTFKNFELIIINDGSTDNCSEIIHSYKDSRIHIIENKHNFINSLNILLDKARGKYIARMDADDIMISNRLEVQYEYMETHPDVDVLSGSAEIISNSFNKGNLKFNTEKNVVAQDLLERNCIINSTSFIRTVSLRKHKLHYEHKFVYAEDYRLWTKFIMCGLTIKIITNVFIKYRKSNDQVTCKYVNKIAKTSELVQTSLSEWICKNHHKNHRNPIIKSSCNKLTVIIPFLNEGCEVINTVKSLREQVNTNVDIIVINDCSTDDYPYKEELKKYNVYYILNKKRKGVAASRDYGVDLCKTPYFLLLDAHMRIYENKWLKTVEKLLNDDDRRLLCMQTKVLYKEKEYLVEAKETNAYGAYNDFNISEYLPSIKWNMKEFYPENEIEPIATVLGAGYLASKRYWTYLKGLKGLICYGHDESYISLKVWMEGGQCLLLKRHCFGHIYRNKSPYKQYNYKNVYNSLLIASTIFPLEIRSWAYATAKVKNLKVYYDAHRILVQRSKMIYELRTYYKKIFKKSLYDILPIHQRCNGFFLSKINTDRKLFSIVF